MTAPGPVAARARLRDREEPLALGLDPAPAALRAHARRRPRLRAGPATGGTRLRRRDAQRHLRAVDRLLERDRDRRLQVLAALRPRPARRLRTRTRTAATARGTALAAPEDVVEDVLEPAEVARGEPAAGAAATGAAGPAAAHAEDPAAVVLLALVGIADQVVGRLDLLEALLGRGITRVVVRVVLAHQPAVRLLDLVLGRLPIDPEDLVGVARGHAATTTFAAPEDLLLVAVPGLVDLRHHAGRHALDGRLRDRLVLVRVERLALGRELLDPDARQGAQQLCWTRRMPLVRWCSASVSSASAAASARSRLSSDGSSSRARRATPRADATSTSRRARLRMLSVSAAARRYRSL